MTFQPGHKKQGGRRVGTQNKLTGEARELARHLLGSAEYQRSLQRRLIRGVAPRIELHLWELAFGKPRGPGGAPEDSVAPADFAAMLEQLSEASGENLRQPLLVAEESGLEGNRPRPSANNQETP